MKRRVFIGWMEKEDTKLNWTTERWAHLPLWLWKKKETKKDSLFDRPPVRVKVTIEEMKT